MAKKPRYRKPLYAVVRVDDFQHDGTPIKHPEELFTVKEITESIAIAREEAERLNNLNGSKGIRYFVTVTRLFDPTGDNDES